MYQCVCCKKMNVPREKPSIGYVCNKCVLAWASGKNCNHDGRP